MNSFSREINQIFRKLLRAPLFTLTTVGTLALGIGANAAIFSIVNGVLLKPLPFEDPEELVGVWHTAPGLGFDQVNSAPALYFTYRDETRVFEEVGQWGQQPGVGHRSSRAGASACELRDGGRPSATPCSTGDRARV